MIDAYVFLTPIIMIGVVSLVVFVGCGSVFDLEEVPPIVVKVPVLTATAGDARVDLQWPVDGAASEFRVKRGDAPGVHTEIGIVPAGTYNYVDTVGIANGTTYYYVVSAVGEDGETDDSNEVAATPSTDASTEYITTHTDGTPVTVSGLFGMVIQVGGSKLKIKELGRLALAGNSQTHVIKFVEAASGADYGAPVAVSMAGAPAGEFKYAGIPDSTPIILQANTAYYVLTQESSPGDQFLNHNTTVTTTNAATVTGAGRSNGATYIMDAAGLVSYGLVNFKYQLQ